MRSLIYICLSIFIVNSAYADDTDNVIISTQSHHISKDTVDIYTEFSIEFISKYENNFNGEYPNLDFAVIQVDVNGNSKLDPDIDRYYSISKEGPCVGLLLTNASSRPCGSFESKAKVFNYFVKTAINPMPHPVVKFLIPTAELLTSKEGVFLTFKTHSANNGYTYYPSKSGADTFSSTYKVRL
jgi:hypothetical protein